MAQSSMYCITKFDVDKQCNEYVDEEIKAILKEKVEAYNYCLKNKQELIANGSYASEEEFDNLMKESRLKILYNIPSGFELTARMTTNYRCLKNIYWQRCDHQLPEWREFCKWVETLPYANELILNKD